MNYTVMSTDDLFAITRKNKSPTANLVYDFINDSVRKSNATSQHFSVLQNKATSERPKMGGAVAFFLTSIIQLANSNALTLCLLQEGESKQHQLACLYSFLFTAGMHFREATDCEHDQEFVSQLKEGLLSSIYLLQKPKSKDNILDLEERMNKQLEYCAHIGPSAEKFAQLIFQTFAALGLGHLNKDETVESVKKYLGALYEEWGTTLSSKR